MDINENAIGAIRAGGQKFCEKAIKIWINSDMSQEQRTKMYQHWKAVESRIGELCNELSRSG